MTPKRIAVALAATLAGVLGVSSIAWACLTAQGPYVNDLFTGRAPAGQEVKVTGGGWASFQPVDIDWRVSSTAAGERLTSASVDASGAFTATTRVPATAPGFYYISVSQGSTTKSMPFEVVGAPVTPPSSASPAPPGPAQQWNGLQGNGSSLQGLHDVAARHSSGGRLGGTLIAGLVVVSGVIALGAFAAVERRRPARVRVRARR